jgi:hypothetical protein
MGSPHVKVDEEGCDADQGTEKQTERRDNRNPDDRLRYVWLLKFMGYAATLAVAGHGRR